MRCRLQAFDLLHLDGGRPDREKAGRPQGAAATADLPGSGRNRPSSIATISRIWGDKVFAQACQLALEGVVSKRADAPYHSGRSDSWGQKQMYRTAGIRHCRLLQIQRCWQRPRLPPARLLSGQGIHLCRPGSEPGSTKHR